MTMSIADSRLLGAYFQLASKPIKLIFIQAIDFIGAPGTIRTSHPQIRSPCATAVQKRELYERLAVHFRKLAGDIEKVMVDRTE
jgi:hypothetical protein